MDTETMNDSEKKAITDAVETRMRSFEAAERALDAEHLIAHFAPGPDFHLYNDGERFSYEAICANLRAGFSSLRSIDGGFEDMHVFVLAPDVALATAQFREVITDQAGGVIRVRGAASWLWRLTDGEWKIVYGHADHYPDEPTG